MMKQEDMKTQPTAEEELQVTTEWIIEQFAEVGLVFENKKSTPQNGESSGIVGNRNKELKVNI